MKKRLRVYFIFVVLLAVVLILCRRDFTCDGASLPPLNEVPAESFHLGVSPIYLQTDSRWANDKIGGSNEKLGAVGCTVCCLSMAFAHHGVNLSPGELNQLLKEHNGYTRRGWVKWNTVSEFTGHKIRICLPKRSSGSLINAALRERNPVIVKIMLPSRIQHWVLIVGRKRKEYLIKDPLGNGKDLEPLTKFNSNILAVRIVTKTQQ